VLNRNYIPLLKSLLLCLTTAPSIGNRSVTCREKRLSKEACMQSHVEYIHARLVESVYHSLKNIHLQLRRDLHK
jgi:hypothetical protein